MATDQVLLNLSQVQAVPLNYIVPGSVELSLQAVTATFDGTGASGSFLPALQIIGPGGVVAATFVDPSNPVGAGGSAEVTFGPFLGGGATSGGAAALVQLYSNTLTSPGSFLLNQIDQSYNDLYGTIVGTSAAVTTMAGVYARLNNDSTSNYYGERLLADGATTAATPYATLTQAEIGAIPGSTGDPGFVGSVEFTIFNYAGSTTKSVHALSNQPRNSSGSYRLAVNTALFFKTAPVTSLFVFSNAAGAPNFATGTTFRLYGRR